MCNSRFQFPVTAFAALLLLIGISSALLAQEQKPVTQEERTTAINVVRLINTAEVLYNSGSKKYSIDTHNRYASWDELYKSGAVKAAQDLPHMAKDLQLSAGLEVIPGHRLDLLVSSDGQSFSVALHDTKEGDGLFSVFSDPSGVIFLGAPPQ